MITEQEVILYYKVAEIIIYDCECQRIIHTSCEKSE
jgi:hypothetical protein